MTSTISGSVRMAPTSALQLLCLTGHRRPQFARLTLLHPIDTADSVTNRYHDVTTAEAQRKLSGQYDSSDSRHVVESLSRPHFSGTICTLDPASTEISDRRPRVEKANAPPADAGRGALRESAISPGPYRPPMASIRLLGRRSVQFSSTTYFGHASRLSPPKTLVHPAGMSAKVGPQRVLILVIDQHEESAILVVGWSSIFSLLSGSYCRRRRSVDGPAGNGVGRIERTAELGPDHPRATAGRPSRDGQVSTRTSRISR